MLSNEGFNLWADQYDESVRQAEESNEYPFAGYNDVLNTIYSRIRERRCRRVLDIGFGTGVLTGALYRAGIDMTGIDFSERMIAIAQEKMPGAHLLCHDFSLGLPAELADARFDAITITYAIHHLTPAHQARFIQELLTHLNPGGEVLIGDVAFATLTDLNNCRQRCGNDWDEDEFYPVAELLKPHFPNVRFEAKSHCAGVMVIPKAE